MKKEYTPIRRFYAIVGFCTIIAGIVYGSIQVVHFLDRRDAQLMSNNYCHAMRDDGTIFVWEC